MSKREAVSLEVALVGDNKRIKADEDSKVRQVAVTKKKHSLKAPLMQLIGHEGEIFTCKFHPSGDTFASAGMDRCIFFWKSSGNCKNYAIFNAAHSNAILDLEYTHSSDRLVSCSADKTVVLWDINTGCRLKKLRNHKSHVNSISVSRNLSNDLIASVGDDCLVNVWDQRQRRKVATYKENYQLTAITFNKDSSQIMTGGIENSINVYDLRQNTIMYSLMGHSDSITGLSLSPDGNHLLSNSMDNTLICWDVKPVCPITRMRKTFSGHQHGFDKNLLRCSWSTDGNMVAAGSADGNVYIWSFYSGQVLYKLPGHKASVNEVAFSPTESLILSCGNDSQMYLGEIDTNLI